MKILSQSQNNKKLVNFTSTPLYKVQIQKLMPDGVYKKIPAYFSELSAGETEDIEAMDELLTKWGYPATYLAAIHVNFSMKIARLKTYAVELIKDKPLAERMLSLSSVKELSKKSMRGDFVQVRPDLRAVNPLGEVVPNRKYTGAGELNVYGAVRQAKENNFNNFHFESANDQFYGSINFFDPNCTSVTEYNYIYPEKMEEFLKGVEHKYHFRRLNM